MSDVEGRHEWQIFEGCDVPLEDSHGQQMPAASPEELESCREECLKIGYGGFATRRGLATFHPLGRRALLERRESTFWERGAALHVAPAAVLASEDDADSVLVSHGSTSRRAASAELLSSRSGYFASLFRHDWADSGTQVKASSSCGKAGEPRDGAVCDGRQTHFAEFPGGERAFEFALSWLCAQDGEAFLEPWPIISCDDLFLAGESAAYLDAPGLLRAATGSWRLARERTADELLHVSGVLVAGSMHFEEHAQEDVIDEIRVMLQEMPKDQLVLSPEFLAAPKAGLAVLDVRRAAKNSIVGHIKSIGGWMMSTASASSNVVATAAAWERRSVAAAARDDARRAAKGMEASSPHDFAVRLFEAHEMFFAGQPEESRRLMSHVDTQVPIPTPLGFRVAAVAAAASHSASDKFHLAWNLLERCLAFAEDPASSAADDSCVVGLFGASGAKPVFGLDVLAKPTVPPAAAAVILSRVLASWAVGVSSKSDDASRARFTLAAVHSDAALEAILAGVVSNRQNLRTFLEAALPRIAAEDADDEISSEWGSALNLAVPELQAAFAYAGERAAAQDVVPDEHVQLLFTVVYRPSGGLVNVRFPLVLLQELRSHSVATQTIVLRRVIEDLESAASSPLVDGWDCAWAKAETLVAAPKWELAEITDVERAVSALRFLLFEAHAGKTERAVSDVDACAVRLLRVLPLQILDDPEGALGPPVPAHVLAGVAFQTSANNASRLAKLEAENRVLRQEVLLLKQHRGS
eukprot:TRINITY_DN9843_c0_g1_i1.p1 TRINITY_DN9843_c0_g1~~TRINITY_DN9843_c0_g1_i1.p1  ORF type:complete len:754 (-),score=141.08 TRINITY_DN9843_c0_g1_i1:48-2309(-)